MLTGASTVVMVEDAEGHSRLIEKNIRRAGTNNEIRVFRAGQEGASYIHALSAHRSGAALLLLDLNLSDMSGIDVLADLKRHQETARIPVVILPTTDDRDEIARCYDLGSNAYVTKPVAYNAFSQTARQLGLFLTIMQIPELAC